MFFLFLNTKTNPYLGGALGLTKITRSASQKKEEDDPPMANVKIASSSKNSLIGSGCAGISYINEEFIFDIQAFGGVHIFSKCKNEDFLHRGFVGVEGSCLYRFEPWLAVGLLIGLEGDFFKSSSYDFHIGSNTKRKGNLKTIEPQNEPHLNYIGGVKINLKHNKKVALYFKYQYVFSRKKTALPTHFKDLSFSGPRFINSTSAPFDIETNYTCQRVLLGFEYIIGD
ncbi:MAG: hypothetical protein H6850_03735 [Alphaproteobacteria bacterium]|nr:MAG: hypothetical protein H6850_03735 [Alphaproteobacteria bacterium]